MYVLFLISHKTYEIWGARGVDYVVLTESKPLFRNFKLREWKRIFSLLLLIVFDCLFSHQVA